MLNFSAVFSADLLNFADETAGMAVNDGLSPHCFKFSRASKVELGCTEIWAVQMKGSTLFQGARYAGELHRTKCTPRHKGQESPLNTCTRHSLCLAVKGSNDNMLLDKWPPPSTLRRPSSQVQCPTANHQRR